MAPLTLGRGTGSSSSSSIPKSEEVTEHMYITTASIYLHVVSLIIKLSFSNSFLIGYRTVAAGTVRGVVT